MILSAFAAAALAVPAPLAPGDTETWNFDITITGDTTWTSPTTVDPGSLAYDFDYVIDTVDVTVTRSFGIPITVDALSTGEVDPALLSGFVNVAGPAPLTFVDIPVVVEDPPNPPAVDLTLSGGIDATGQGFVSATDVVLGSIEVDTGIFGVQTLPIQSIRIAGTVVVTETQWVGLGNGLPDDPLAGPSLRGQGVLLPSTPLTLTVERAAASSPTTLVIGIAELGAPLKGGVLVPTPDVLVDGLVTDANGAIVLPGVWPTGIPSGFSVYLQAWSVDASGPQGFTATNGVSGTAQ